MTTIVLSDTVHEYLVPEVRKTSYAAVKSKRLQQLLEKLAKFGSSCRDAPSKEKGEKRRKEADAVGRIFPG
jgi:exocyst complex component 6